MKNYYLLRAIGNVLRAILLVVAVMAIVIALLWPCFGERINSYDDKVIRAYERTYQFSLQQAKDLESNTPLEAIAAYRSFLDDAESIHKNDRLYSLKRSAFKNLGMLLRKQGRNLQALELAKQWAEHDERDISALVERGLALYGVEEFQLRGRQTLANLYKRFPESKLIADAYSSVYINDGDFTSAFLVLANNHKLAMQQDFPQLGWEIFWSSGGDFDATKSKSVWGRIDSTQNIQIRLPVPLDASVIRIDVPASLAIALVKPTLYLYENQRLKRSLQLWQLPLTLKQLNLGDASLFADGGDDPFFAWSLPNNFKKPGRSLVFKAGLSHPISKHLLSLSSNHPSLIERELRALGETDAINLLVRIVAGEVLSTSESNSK